MVRCALQLEQRRWLVEMTLKYSDKRKLNLKNRPWSRQRSDGQKSTSSEMNRSYLYWKTNGFKMQFEKAAKLSNIYYKT